MRRLLIAVLLSTIVVGNVGIAVSQPTPSDRERALSLFRESDVYYKRGEFETAAQLLREAYGLYPEPLLVYNLARALEGSGDFEGAIEQYESYLKTATEIPDRGAIERRIATLKLQVAARNAITVPGGSGEPTPLPPPSGTPDKPPSAPVADIDPRGPETQGSPRRIPWLVAGGGVAILGAGAAFGYLSQSRHDAAVDEPVQREAAALQDQAKQFATISTVALIAGGVITVGGVTWGVIELQRGGGRGEPAPRVAGARIDIGLGSVQATWSFE